MNIIDRYMKVAVERYKQYGPSDRFIFARSGSHFCGSFLLPFWISIDGRSIFADKADEEHLLNIIRFIQRKKSVEDQRYLLAPELSNEEFFCRYIARAPLWINFTYEALRRKLDFANLYGAPVPVVAQEKVCISKRKEVGRTASLASIIGANKPRGPIGVLSRGGSPFGKPKIK